MRLGDALAWVILGATLAPAAGDDTPAAPFEPTSRYEARRVEGWEVLIHKGFLDSQPDLAERTLTHLRHQLYQVTTRVPPGPLEKLREIAIWVEEAEGHHPCMAYHPDADWLREHDMNPEKARCVEVANARSFLDWTADQPWMILHELAHGYHHRFLKDGFENAEVRAAFEDSMKARRYESVLRIDGREERAYAMTNPMEYFAEATEAFFGTNDYFPFVRSESKRHDPGMFALLGRLWETTARAETSATGPPERS